MSHQNVIFWKVTFRPNGNNWIFIDMNVYQCKCGNFLSYCKFVFM